MINADWARWIHASIVKYYKSVSASLSVPMYVEGTDQITSTLSEYFELRIVGPFIREIPSNQYEIDVNINILVTVAKSKADNFRIHKIGGELMSKAVEIPIYKLGSLTGDDASTKIFCLTPSNIPVKWVFLGRIDRQTGILQGVVDSKYRTKKGP